MSEANQIAYVVRVRRPNLAGVSGPTVVFYAVLAENEHEAMKAVSKAVLPGDNIDPTGGKLAPETARVLDLQPGVPRPM